MTALYTNNEYWVFHRYDNKTRHTAYSSLSDAFSGDGGFMAFELTPKWEKNKFVIVTLFLILIMYILWCVFSANRNYPYLVAERWICTEPCFTLSYTREESNSIHSSETITLDDKVIEVEIAFLMNEYCVFPKGSSAYDERLFSGTWRYDKGNLVFIIDEDFIFHNRYSKLCFAPSRVE